MSKNPVATLDNVELYPVNCVFAMISLLDIPTKSSFLIVFLAKQINKPLNTLKQNIEKNEGYIGKKVDLDGDTLTIIKAGVGTVTLSNGVEVDVKVLESILIY